MQSSLGPSLSKCSSLAMAGNKEDKKSPKKSYITCGLKHIAYENLASDLSNLLVIILSCHYILSLLANQIIAVFGVLQNVALLL